MRAAAATLGRVPVAVRALVGDFDHERRGDEALERDLRDAGARAVAALHHAADALAVRARLAGAQRVDGVQDPLLVARLRHRGGGGGGGGGEGGGCGGGGAVNGCG